MPRHWPDRSAFHWQRPGILRKLPHHQMALITRKSKSKADRWRNLTFGRLAIKKKRKLKGKNGWPWISFSQKSPVKSAGQMQRNWRLGPTVAQVAPLRQGELLQGSTGIWHNWPKNRQNVSPAGIATLLSGGWSRKLQRCHLVRGVIWFVWSV